MPRAPNKTSTPLPLPQSGSGPPCPAADPGRLKIQIKFTLGDRVFETPPFEMPAAEFAALRHLMETFTGHPAGPSRSTRFALQRGPRVWQLTYAGETASFPHKRGMVFVAYLLKYPRQPIHPLELLARVQGQDPVQQRSAALDDAEATRAYLREMERLRALIESDETSDR